MGNKKIILDFETFYDTKSGYSLTKMPTFQYVSDPRFKAHGLSVVEYDDPDNGYWVTGDDIPAFIEDMNGFKNHTVVAHNASFDMLIMAFRFGCIPPDIIDTMGMANVLVYPFTNSASLQACSRYYGLEGKMRDILASTNGIRDLPADMEHSLSEYAVQDSVMTYEILRAMEKEFPEVEYPILNIHVQMYLAERMKIDREKLSNIYDEIEEMKQHHLKQLCELWPEQTDGVDVWKELRATKGTFLAECIKSEGLLPPRKRSKTTGKLTYAFAKTDLVWLAMRSHSKKMAALVDAKLFASSTIVVRRAERFMLMHDQMDGYAHPLLNYSRARTGRCLSGDTMITVLREGKIENVRLTRVRDSDLVWDGQEFVQHDGLIYQGTVEVIEYAGIIGTPDHKVKISEGRFVPLEKAKKMGYQLAAGETPAANKVEVGVSREVGQYEKPKSRVDRRADYSSGERKTSPSKIPVFDILNCGPRHQFVANGFIVSNSSGGDKCNFQNLPKKPEAFRHSFVPKKGSKVVICDSGQIEARVLAYLAGQEDLLEAFREADALIAQGQDPKALGKDVYTVMASKIGSDSRQLGKATVLGCGFGMGENTFVLNAKADPNMDATETMLRGAWSGWRVANPMTVRFWDTYENAFKMAAISRKTVKISGVELSPYKEDGVKVTLPSGRFFLYSDVRMTAGGLMDARGKLWFGCLVENLVQAFARDVVFYQSLTCPEIVNNLWLMVHDEVDLVVREEEVPQVVEAVEKAFATPPEWCADLPVIGESVVADHLIKA